MIKFGLFLTFVLFLCFACKEPAENDPCIFVSLITIQSGCYSPDHGLSLRATGRDNAPVYCEWYIYVLKDTLDGFIPRDLKIKEVKYESITIPDSILLDNKKIDVRATTNCGGQIRDSMFFAFVKTTSNNCVTWIKHDQ